MTGPTSETELRTLYRDPSAGAANKAIDHVDQHVADFLARCPFLVFATGSSDGLDASPRGGTPGFVTVLDTHRIAFGDLSGNNRLDSFTNVVREPEVALLAMIPGLDETVRINGTAGLSTDADVLEACAIDGRTPKVAVVITVREAYLHCAKALRRAQLWETESWPEPAACPSPGAMLNDHIGLGVDPAVIDADLEKAYEATMWTTGGDE